MGLVLEWFFLTCAFWLTAEFLDGISVDSFVSGAVAAALFGILNFFLGWLIFGLIGIFTLGIGFLLAFATRLVVDAIILQFVGSITDRLKVESFKVAVIGAVLISVFGTLLQWLGRASGLTAL
jgi:uncharacterized membrane protein YvlD (DUF360 family)